MGEMTDSPVYRESLRKVLDILPVDQPGAATVLITGATGLIGSAVVDVLLASNEFRGTKYRVLAAGRSAERIRERFGARADLVPVSYDATDAEIHPFKADYVIHAASNASPDRYMQEPVETMLANFQGLYGLLCQAKAGGVKRLLYVSSSEVYGAKTKPGAWCEEDAGVVSHLNVRASYAEAKRAAETLAVSYSSEYGLPVVLVRPGHVYGPTARRSDRRVSSDFAFRAAAGEPLELKSDGAQLRSYCHCLDCATAILTVLWKGEVRMAYNVSNPDSVITIRRMAELLAAAGDVEVRFGMPTQAERAAFNPMADSSLCADRLSALGWRGVFSAAEGFAQTVRVLREVK